MTPLRQLAWLGVQSPRSTQCSASPVLTSTLMRTRRTSQTVTHSVWLTACSSCVRGDLSKLVSVCGVRVYALTPLTHSPQYARTHQHATARVAARCALCVVRAAGRACADGTQSVSAVFACALCICVCMCVCCTLCTRVHSQRAHSAQEALSHRTWLTPKSSAVSVMLCSVRACVRARVCVCDTMSNISNSTPCTRHRCTSWRVAHT
jgi:hypothetical protein